MIGMVQSDEGDVRNIVEAPDPSLPATGLERIATSFRRAAAESRAALMPYYTLGFPSLDMSLDVIIAIAKSGADLIELGIPFSDPLADGPTIQRSTQAALCAGASVSRCLGQVASLRERGVDQPLLLMWYYNPILAFGVQRFVQRSKDSGADGFIVPDLPPQEAGEMESLSHEYGMALVYLLAPTSPPERIAEVAARTTGFLYLVSLTGVTGARRTLPPGLEAFLERARRSAHTPVAVGFGISTPEQARAVGQLADGVIVGSALIDAVERSPDPAIAAGAFIRSMTSALHIKKSS